MQESAYQERRSSERFDFKRRVEVQIPGLKQRIEAHSLDVSIGGMRLSVADPVDLNFPLRLKIVDAAREAIECDGRIAWMQRGALKNGIFTTPYEAGLRFTKTPDELKRVIDGLRPSKRISPKDFASIKKPVGLEPVFIKGKFYAPKIKQERVYSMKWRLDVLADGHEISIGVFDSAQDAFDGWGAFSHNLKISTADKIKRLFKKPAWAVKYAAFGYLVAWSLNAFFVPSEWPTIPESKRPELVLWVKGIHW
jgi:hypothetical protein